MSTILVWVEHHKHLVTIGEYLEIKYDNKILKTIVKKKINPELLELQIIEPLIKHANLNTCSIVFENIEYPGYFQIEENEEDFGTCCFCQCACNPCSQSCSRCARSLSTCRFT